MKRLAVLIVWALLLLTLGVALFCFGSFPWVVLTWETASEVNTAGFLVYRSDRAEGPFVLLSETPIPATGDPLTGASYRYVDRDVRWGRRYFYQLEEIERDGGRSRLPQVVDARAGIGWEWALVGGALLALVGAGAGWCALRDGRS